MKCVLVNTGIFSRYSYEMTRNTAGLCELNDITGH